MIPFVSWPTTKVEIVKYMFGWSGTKNKKITNYYTKLQVDEIDLKLGASTLIIRGTFTHFKSMVLCHTHAVQGCATKHTYHMCVCCVYTSKISTLCLSHWIQHFCTARQFCNVSGGNLIEHIHFKSWIKKYAYFN
jgi:hypothetical protein